MMKTFLSALVALTLFTSTHAQASERVVANVKIDQAQMAAAGTTPPPDRIYCDGYSPDDPICEGSFILTTNFNIVISFATSYFGGLVLRGETTTGSVNVFCDATYTIGTPDCGYQHTGVFIEGQRFTLRSVAAGEGYWRVRVPG